MRCSKKALRLRTRQGLGGSQDGRGACTAGSQSLGVVVSAPEGGEVRLWPLRDQRETSQVGGKEGASAVCMGGARWHPTPT